MVEYIIPPGSNIQIIFNFIDVYFYEDNFDEPTITQKIPLKGVSFFELHINGEYSGQLIHHDDNSSCVILKNVVKIVDDKIYMVI